MKRVSLVVAPPGTLLSAVAETCRASAPHLDIHDVESLLISELPDRARATAKTRMRDIHSALTMREFVTSHPRRKVMEHWAAALRAIFSSVKQSPRSAAIFGHLHLFGVDRSEFYSTSSIVQREAGRANLNIHHVIVLIDDVFDMWARLSAPDGTLSAETRQARYADQTAKAAPEHLILETYNNDLVVENRVSTLETLISWRRSEMLAAEALAEGLGAKFTPLGIKHPIWALEKLLATEPSPATVYISHPITRPRTRLQQSSDPLTARWDPVVDECNNLPGVLADGNLVAIMPTAIDEYRLQPPGKEAGSLYDRPLLVGRRWPLMDRTILTRSAQAEVDIEHARILLPPGEDVAAHPQVAAAQMRALEASIWSEIPFRDHMIVARTDHLLVFRPFSDKGEFSGGVMAEIAHWWQAVQSGDARRRAAFIHFAEDLSAIIQRWIESGSEETARNMRVIAEDDMRRLRDLNRSQADQVLAGNPIPAGLLGGRHDLGDKLAAVQAATNGWEVAAHDFLLLGLTDIARPNDQARVFVFGNDAKVSHEQFVDVVEFLNGKSADTAPGSAKIIDEDQMLRRLLFRGKTAAKWAKELAGLGVAH